MDYRLVEKLNPDKLICSLLYGRCRNLRTTEAYRKVKPYLDSPALVDKENK